MKTELSHDIIAEKIWDRLPEHDKRFRDIERSIQQRTQDFRRGTGDYLGPKELAAWEDAFARLPPESEEYIFIQNSKTFRQKEKEDAEKEAREKFERGRRINIVFILLFLLLVYLAHRSCKAEKLAEYREQKARKSEKKALKALEKKEIAEFEPIYQDANGILDSPTTNCPTEEMRQAIADMESKYPHNVELQDKIKTIKSKLRNKNCL